MPEKYFIFLNAHINFFYYSFAFTLTIMIIDHQLSSQLKDWILDEEFIFIFPQVVKYNKSKKILHAGRK